MTEQTFDWKSVRVGEARERIEEIDADIRHIQQKMRELETTKFLLENERKTMMWIIEKKTGMKYHNPHYVSINSTLD